MARKHSPVADYLIYLLARTVICIIQVLPFRLALTLADGLAYLIYHLDRRHRLVADDNLRQAFPGRYSDAERDGMVRGVYQHFCRLLMEILFMSRILQTTTWSRHACLAEGGRHLVGGLLSGRPLFLVTGHFGNWEAAGYLINMLGFHTHAIARPLDNPYVDRLLRSLREKKGQKILAKKGTKGVVRTEKDDFDRMQEVLARGGAIATLGDQDAGQKGQFVNFFGRPASTHKAIAILSLEYNVPLLVMALVRTGPNLEYKALFADLIDPDHYRGRSDAIPAMTQRFTLALETLIRQYPEQYFWLHRRWKNQPKLRGKKQAA